MQVIQNDVIKCCKMMSSNVVLLHSNNCCVVLKPAICEDRDVHVAIFYLSVLIGTRWITVAIVFVIGILLRNYGNSGSIIPLLVIIIIKTISLSKYLYPILSVISSSISTISHFLYFMFNQIKHIN